MPKDNKPRVKRGSLISRLMGMKTDTVKASRRPTTNLGTQVTRSGKIIRRKRKRSR